MRCVSGASAAGFEPGRRPMHVPIHALTRSGMTPAPAAATLPPRLAC